MAPAMKTVEETYKKKSQLEHILIRPDTYIGSVEKHDQTMWVYEQGQMVYKTISYVPGLYKVFDEILVNAADNKQRDPKMDSVKVDIDPDRNLISVYNNGDGVPVDVHKEEGVWVPELIFGHLLTSSNYDDTVKKTTGGRNGYGAKLTNIFSTEFLIETADGKRKKRYRQVFSNNMTKKEDPEIQGCKATENWTRVTFKPDLAKFNMTHLEDDVVFLMKKRVVDLAGCLGKTVKVELNGELIQIKSFHDYAQLYLDTANRSREKALPRIDRDNKDNPRWQISVSLSDGQFQQVSFVNGINTIRGGTHVDYITSQITKHVIEVVKKKNKNANLKPHTVRNHLWVFVNSLIDNPAFDSQTKETLTSRASSFGTTCELPKEFLDKVAKCGVVENLLSWAEFKQNKDLKKTDGTKTRRITDIPKLEDANEAGGRNSDKCTLILTEGDSAKALAMAGLSVVGRDYYGVFPLRGKLLNVREASAAQISNNAEINAIKKILGLKQGEKYEKQDSVKSLRYGHLMIMADQDHDGSHIKGLLINFIHTFWPSLLRAPSFMLEFITPIVKATRKQGKQVISFYTMPEYESWVERMGVQLKGWSVKYYKGLGTSEAKEGKEYFKDLGRHRKIFIWESNEDGEAIELAFSKKKIEARKDWLREFEAGTFLNQKGKEIKYSDFVHKELKLFSLADLQRSIPSMVDGFKPTQRKVLFCAFKRNLIKEIKVGQFSGYVSENSAYHHGEQSIQTTVVGMAQNFVGTNNINLLRPKGQFGTRNLGGKDAASARYIFTQLSRVTRFLFPKDDDVLLDHLKEDGLSIEPTWYVPIIPMVLVNGSEGIGTGWSTFIPNYNPRDIISNIRRMLDGESLMPMDPWYKGFNGTIQKSATKESGVTYTVSGIIEEVNCNSVEDGENDVDDADDNGDAVIRITELPIRRWTQDYKEFLESLLASNDKTKEAFIKDFRDYSTDTVASFEVTLSKKKLIQAKQEGLLKKFKLTTSISTSNMHLFSQSGIIKKYDSPEQILKEFFTIRLDYYDKRKQVYLDKYELDMLKLDNQVKFILGVVEGEIVVSRRKKAELVSELRERGFTPFPKNGKTVEAAVVGATDNNGDTEDSEVEDNVKKVSVDAIDTHNSDYDYLLSMPIGALTYEKVQELCGQKERLNQTIDDLRKSTPEFLWLKDINALEEELDEIDKHDEKEAQQGAKDVAMRISRQPAKNPPRKNTQKASKSQTVPDSSVSSDDMIETENLPPQPVKAKGRAGAKKKTTAKGRGRVVEDDEDDDILELSQRLANYHPGSSPDNLADNHPPQPVKPKGKAGAKKATAKGMAIVQEVEEEDEEDEIPDLKERLANYHLDSSPENSTAMETGTPDEKRKPLAVVNEISDGDEDDHDIEVAKKGKGKTTTSKAAASKKPPAAAMKKRGQTQKPTTETLKVKEKSPEKKVRRMRPSPFNKKSGSVMDEDASEDEEEVSEVVVAAARTRPQRANKKPTTFVLSDSESEKQEGDSDSDFDSDSEFHGDDD